MRFSNLSINEKVLFYYDYLMRESLTLDPILLTLQVWGKDALIAVFFFK